MQWLTIFKKVAAGGLLLFPAVVFAVTDSSAPFISQPPPATSTTSTAPVTPPTPASATQNICETYGFYMNTYADTVPTAAVSPPHYPSGTSIPLSLYGDAGLPGLVRVGCKGIQKVVYSFILQANDNVDKITLTINVQTSKGVVTTVGYLYPRCRNTSYTEPLCTVSEFSASIDTPELEPGDEIHAPSIEASSPIVVKGGMFNVYFVPGT